MEGYEWRGQGRGGGGWMLRTVGEGSGPSWVEGGEGEGEAKALEKSGSSRGLFLRPQNGVGALGWW